MLSVGIKNKCETVVDHNNTAKFLGSGELPVFSTPSMVALMEQTCQQSVASELEDGQGTVGTKLEVTHDAATPLGMKVYAESELIEVDNRRLVFNVTAYDECGVIGTCRHERFIISNEKFLSKVNAKAAK